VSGDWDEFRIFIDSSQKLCTSGRNGWLEPICPICTTPIAWVLDMMSFNCDEGMFVACHARCVWTPEAFDRERHRGTEIALVESKEARRER
jgi:hypothetical protein